MPSAARATGPRTALHPRALGGPEQLIDAIVMTPDQGELRIELKGNLAAMLGATVQSKRSPKTGDLLLQVSMVAGAGFEPATFGL